MTRLIIIISMLLPGFLMAQVSKERDVISNGGNYSTASGISLSWTVGQIAVSSSQNTNLIVTEGFQQADKVSVGIEEIEFTGDIRVFPNPVQYALNFEISNVQDAELMGELFDLTGRKILEIPAVYVHKVYTGTIDFSTLTAGKWLLRFSKIDGTVVKTFTVVKAE